MNGDCSYLYIIHLLCTNQNMPLILKNGWGFLWIALFLLLRRKDCVKHGRCANMLVQSMKTGMQFETSLKPLSVPCIPHLHSDWSQLLVHNPASRDNNYSKKSDFGSDLRPLKTNSWEKEPAPLTLRNLILGFWDCYGQLDWLDKDVMPHGPKKEIQQGSMRQGTWCLTLPAIKKKSHVTLKGSREGWVPWAGLDPRQNI